MRQATLKHVLSRAIKAVLPARYWTHLQSIRARNHERRWLKKSGVLELARRFSECQGSTVLKGPFAGMKYTAGAILGRNSVPKLLGSYECELHEIIESALRSNHHRVIDVGSAEGYYAVGFALKRGCHVVAFDTDPRELMQCRGIARLNAVGNLIETRHWCSPEMLRVLAADVPCFILSDCEGYETELFDEVTVAGLTRSDVLIEIHGSAYELLLGRFSKTHAVRTLVALDRPASDYPELACLGGAGALAVAEYRPRGQRWLFAKSLAG